MKLVFWDTETHPIQPGMVFPRLVCAQYIEETPGAPPTDPVVLTRPDALEWFARNIKDPEVHWVGHNLAYDFGIMAAECPDLLRDIWEVYRTGRAHCTEMRQRLLDIAAGVFKWDEDEAGNAVKNTYGLGDIMTRMTGVWHKKAKGAAAEDTWRLNYWRLDGVPLAAWPPEAVDYCKKDATDTREVFWWQDAQGRREGCPQNPAGPITMIPDADRRAETSWVLHLMAGHGVRTSGEPVAALREFLENERAASMVHLRAAGIVKPGKKDGKLVDVRDMKRIESIVRECFENRGEAVPLTDGGKDKDPAKKKPKTDEDTLLASGDGRLIILAHAMGGMKLLNTYVPILERGTRWPITSRPNACVDTGRTSWSKPNLQNPPRKGGVRECFVPRPGWVFCSVDFDTIELRSLAQRCLEWFGWSVMADCLRRGEDLHIALAADMLGIDYAEAAARYAAGDPILDELRQDAKMANFGFPGGMGVRKFLVTQAETVKKKVKADPSFSPMEWGARLRNGWMGKYREMKPYLDRISKVTADEGPRRVVHEWSNRVRGGLDYCSAANGEFQGRTADGALLAARRVSWECYLGDGPLLGCRPVVFLHDEVIAEFPEAIAHEAAEQMTSIMIGAMAEVIPDIPITSKPVLTRCWYKGAKPIKIEGRLVPSKPFKDAEGKVTWVADIG